MGMAILFHATLDANAMRASCTTPFICRQTSIIRCFPLFLMVSTLNRISSSARSHLFENLNELLGCSDFITSPESSHYQQMKFTTKSSQNASHVTSHKHLIFQRRQCIHKPQASNLPKNTVHTLCLLHYKERLVERDKGLHATTVEA